jgi:hypothetical protein
MFVSHLHPFEQLENNPVFLPGIPIIAPDDNVSLKGKTLTEQIPDSRERNIQLLLNFPD